MSERLRPLAIQRCGELCRALGWRPDHFWQCTPAEISCILTNQTGSSDTGLTRDALDALLEQDKHDRRS